VPTIGRRLAWGCCPDVGVRHRTYLPYLGMVPHTYGKWWVVADGRTGLAGDNKGTRTGVGDATWARWGKGLAIGQAIYPT
jgi:hypothetical protein